MINNEFSRFSAKGVLAVNYVILFRVFCDEKPFKVMHMNFSFQINPNQLVSFGVTRIFLFMYSRFLFYSY